MGHGARLGDALAACPELAGRSRRWVKAQLIDAGRVAVNGRMQRFATARVMVGDQISFWPPDQEASLPRLQLLASRADCWIWDKPAGVWCDPRGARGPLLVDLVAAATGTAPESIFLGHRLDAQTSGAIGVARNRAAAEYLRAQFASRQAEKIYLAVVHGLRPVGERWTVASRLGGFCARRQQVTTLAGQPANSWTQFEVLAVCRRRRLSWVRASPLTGRTHQIRVHLAASGLPIVGDARYGTRESPLPFHGLHAWSLRLVLPDGTTLAGEAALPSGWQAAGLELPPEAQQSVRRCLSAAAVSRSC